MELTTTKSQALLERNSQWIPGGLASLNRKTAEPIAFARAKGSRMWDLDGNEYIDYHAGFAPYILGHNDDDVNNAIRAAMDAELSNYGSGPTESEGELARLFLECLPLADKVQFFNTGSEATLQAIRVSRAATGRDHILKMQGGYNGHHNMVAANLMSSKDELKGHKVAGDEYPFAPITAGIPGPEAQLIHAVEYNDLDAVEAVLRHKEIACIILEPVLQNIGIVEPAEGYLNGLRQLADRYGCLLVFDEVKTGFRSALGGYQSICGITPDLSTFGKAFANGMPIAALAGRDNYMQLATSTDAGKRVLVAGTYNAHPIPVAAAIACLNKLRDPDAQVYTKLEGLAQRLEDGQRELFARYEVPAVIRRVGSAHCVYFAQKAPTNWWDILETHDFDFDARYRKDLIHRGIYNFPVPCKQGSISYAHSEADIDQTLNATNETLAALCG